MDKLHVDVVGTLPTDDSASDIGRLIIVVNRPGMSEAAVMHKVVGLDANRVDETDTCCASADADGRKLFETDGAKEPPVLYKLEDRVISGIISLKAECKIAKVVLAACLLLSMLCYGHPREREWRGWRYFSFHQLLYVVTNNVLSA